jgi:hypothetical protein
MAKSPFTKYEKSAKDKRDDMKGAKGAKPAAGKKLPPWLMKGKKAGRGK